MYDKLMSDFKKELLDRKLERNVLLSFLGLLSVFLVVYFILFNIYGNWVVLLACNVVLIVFSGVMAYTILFITVKKKNNFASKDFFRFKYVYRSLKNVLKNDVQILSVLIKTHGINTRPKIQEAIRHYQFLLSRKSNNGFAVASVISLTVSILGIIFSALKYESNKDLILLFIMLCSILFCVTLICIFIKVIYRSMYYNLSEYSLYERIEAALSEIWMKNLI